MNILITGCGRGIGYHTALELSSLPGVSVLAMSRNLKNLDKLEKEARKKCPKAKLFPMHFDLETGNQKALADLLRKKAKKVDVLINNAAAIVVKPFGKLSEEDWQHVYNVNVIRTASLIRNLTPLMERTGKDKSHIVNISSMGGFQGSMKFIGMSAYSSSKAALCSLTESLAVELAEKNISVNCLCLGAVDTDMLRKAFPGYKAPVNASQMGRYIANFAMHGQEFQNGKIIPVSLSTP